ncbi:MAG: T9SS type A sorting domain-containing protein [Bacteroidia bacterium]|nr:T9SS type A sorting domain-containing protein [Bacteroidia bacterium]
MLDNITDGTALKDFGNAIVFLNNFLYVTGFENAAPEGGNDNNGGRFYIRQYNTIPAISLADGMTYSEGEGNEIITFNGDLYAAGYESGAVSNIRIYRVNPNNLYEISSYNGATNGTASPTINDEATDLVFDNNGNLFITGFFQGTAASTYINDGVRDIFVNRLDPLAVPIVSNWSSALTSSSAFDERSHAIAFDNAGNHLYITGTFTVQTILSNDVLTSLSGIPDLYWDMYVARLSDEGNTGEFKVLQTQQENTQQLPDEGIISRMYSNGYVKIYPNPAKTEVNIDYSFTGDTDSKIEFIDITGRTIIKKNLLLQKSGIYTLDIENIVPGIYYITLRNNYINFNTKIVIQ